MIELMDTQALLEYVYDNTPDRINALHNNLTWYWGHGWLVATVTDDGNMYTTKQANDFCRILKAYTMTEAAQHMTDRLGRPVSVRPTITNLCRADKSNRFHIGKPPRIPIDKLPVLEEVIRAHFAPSTVEPITHYAAREITDHLMKQWTIFQMAEKCGISDNMLRRCRNGSRTMTHEVYHKLQELSLKGDTE